MSFRAWFSMKARKKKIWTFTKFLSFFKMINLSANYFFFSYCFSSEINCTLIPRFFYFFNKTIDKEILLIQAIKRMSFVKFTWRVFLGVADRSLNNSRTTTHLIRVRTLASVRYNRWINDLVKRKRHFEVFNPVKSLAIKSKMPCFLLFSFFAFLPPSPLPISSNS